MKSNYRIFHILELFTLISLLQSAVLAGSYFLVGVPEGIETPVNDSYVIYLENTEDIDHARGLIQFGPSFGQPIVVVRILPELGADHINRNYTTPGSPAWNWKIPEFLGFADVTAEVLDYLLHDIPEDSQEWFETTEGLLGAWDLTVVKELSLIPNITVIDVFQDGILLEVMNLTVSESCKVYMSTTMKGNWTIVDTFQASSPVMTRLLDIPEIGSSFFFSISAE